MYINAFHIKHHMYCIKVHIVEKEKNIVSDKFTDIGEQHGSRDDNGERQQSWIHLGDLIDFKLG